MSLLEHIGEGGTVNGGDYENIRTFGDHVFDLGQLVGDVVVGKLQVGFVAEGFEGRNHALAIGNPTGGSFGGHGNADQFSFAGGFASGWFFAVVLSGCDHGSFMANLYSQVSLVDLYVGLSKCLVFGTAVGLIAGYLGLQTTGGAAGVGKAANNTVTYTIVLILVCDYLASMLLLSLGL